MADKTPPDNPIKDAVNQAQKANVLELKHGGKGKQAQQGSNPNDVITWESSHKNNEGYKVVNGEFCQYKQGREIPIKIPLCDGTYEITEEITYEDGLNDKAFFRISGIRKDGLSLPTVDILLSKFNMGSWITEAWGSRAIVYSGNTKKDNLRVAILIYSTRNGDIPRQHVYGMTGWKKINESWHYLTGSGAISANGLGTSVQVDLGSGHMAKYSLPEPPTLEQLKADITALDDLLNICPNRLEIGATLLAAVARAVLGECHLTDFAIFIQGQTGWGKSSCAAIASAFFGSFDTHSLPANFSDSDSDIEAKGHQIKDGVYVIDDFKPATNAVEATKLHAKAERFIRNTGNGAGRGRRNPDMTAKAAPFNRSLTIMTGEDLPKGQSILARLLVIELSPGDINIVTMRRLEQAARDGALMRIMTAYIKWLAPRMDTLKQEFPGDVRDISEVEGKVANSHNRSPEMFANLVAGAYKFFDFLRGVDVIDTAKQNEWMNLTKSALVEVFKNQSSYQQEQDEVERFADLLRSVLSSGNGHISTAENQAPPSVRPYVFGWSKNHETNEYRANGDLFGWHWHKDGKDGQIWLDKNTTYRLISEFARRQGEPFLMSSSTLWRRLYDRGLLLATEKRKDGAGQLDVKRTIGGYSKRVLVIAESWLLPTPETEQKPNDEIK